MTLSRPVPLALAALLACFAAAAFADDGELAMPNFADLKAAAAKSVAAPPAQAAAAPRFAGAAESVDLSAQFPRTRDGEMQGYIGSCHDFATVALLETALKRVSGETRLLSPTDLFVHRTLADVAHAESAYVSGGVSRAREADVSEGDQLANDVSYALAHGVATLKDEPYWPFYSEYRDGYLPQLKSRLTVAEEDLSADQRAALKLALRRKVPAGDEVEQARFRQEAAKIRQTVADRVIAPELEDIVQRTDRQFPKAKASREQTQRLLQGFRIERRDYVTSFVTVGDRGSAPRTVSYTQLNQTPPAFCLDEGGEQGAWIMGQLAKSRPVAIALDVAGMDTWKTSRQTGKPLNHAIVVIGYRREGGRLSFQTLNWWGPNRLGGSTDYPIRDDQFCHIYQAVAILGPGER